MDEVELTSAETRTRTLVNYVFTATWEAFYAWEEVEARHMLASLQASDSALVASTSGRLFNDEGGVEDLPEATMSCEETFTVWKASELGAHSLLEIETVVEATPTVGAYPIYEVCTPVARNIMLVDDPDLMPFLPLADDPTFVHVEFMADHKGVRWQEPAQDPDCE